MAKAVKNNLRLNGTLSPKSFKMARENAISVAMGIPQPLTVSGLLLNNKNNPTGMIIPPSAPRIGKETFLMEFNSPIRNSLFISNPIRKKKMAIKPSLIHKINGLFNSKFSVEKPILYCQSAW